MGLAATAADVEVTCVKFDIQEAIGVTEPLDQYMASRIFDPFKLPAAQSVSTCCVWA